MRDYSQLEILCQRAYFSTEPISAGGFTFLNGLLYHLIEEYMNENDEALASFDSKLYADMCERNFCAGIQQYEGLVVPSLEHIQALILGVRVV